MRKQAIALSFSLVLATATLSATTPRDDQPWQKHYEDVQEQCDERMRLCEQGEAIAGISDTLEDAYCDSLEEAAAELRRIKEGTDREALSVEEFSWYCMSLAVLCVSVEEYQKAILWMETAIENYEKLGSRDNQIYINLIAYTGYVALIAGEKDKCIAYYKRAEREWVEQSLLLNDEFVALLEGTGRILDELDLDGEALAYYLRSNEVRKQLGHSGTTDHAWILRKIGHIHSEQEREQEALAAFLESKQIRDGVGVKDELGYVYLHCNIGDSYRTLGMLDEALKFYRMSFDIDKKLKRMSDTMYAETHCDIGRVYVKKGDYKKAIKAYQKASEHLLAKGLGAIQKHGHVLWCAANAYKSMGMPENALESAFEAENIYREGDSYWYLSRLLRVIGDIHLAQNDLDGAMTYYLEAEEVHDCLEEPRRIEYSHLLRSMSRANGMTGDYASALAELDRSEKILLELGEEGSNDFAYLLWAKAHVLKKMGVPLEKVLVDLMAAVTIYRENGATGRSDYHDLLQFVAKTYFEAGMKDEGAETLGEVIAVVDELGLPRGQVYAGMCQGRGAYLIGKGKLDEGQVFLLKAEKALKSAKDKKVETVASTEFFLGMVNYKKGLYKKAVRYFKSSTARLEKAGVKNKEYFNGLMLLQVSLNKAGKGKQAIKKLEKQLASMVESGQTLTISYADYLFVLSGLYATAGNQDKSFKVLLEAVGVCETLEIVKKENYANMLCSLGWKYHERSDYKSSVRYSNRCLELSPLHLQALINRGWSYLYLGEWGKASADFRRVLFEDPEHIYGWYDLAISQWHLESRAESLASFEKAFQLGWNEFGAITEADRRPPFVDEIVVDKEFSELLAEYMDVKQ